MKKLLILLGTFLAVVNSHGQVANPQLVITELNESIVASYNGSSISPSISGSQNNWTITLPTGFAFFGPGDTFELSEPENANQHNEVEITATTVVTWKSELTGGGGVEVEDFVDFENAGTFTSPGAAPVFFDLVLSDQVPETGSTAALLGIAVAGLLLVEKRCRAAMGRC
jgi:hypothetical protein